MRILDVHVHYNGNAAEAERFVSAWRGGGIEKAAVFATNANDGSHPSVSDVAALAARFPDFFIPFGYVNPGHDDGVAVVREAAARGFKGVKFIYPAKPYDEDEYLPIYEEAAKAGMVCLFHTGVVIGTVGRGGVHGIDFQREWRVSSNYMRPAHLDRIARVFPEMSIIGAHVGGGAWYEEATAVTRWNANVYFDMSIGQFHYVRKSAPPASRPDGLSSRWVSGSQRETRGPGGSEDPRAIRPRIRELYDVGQLRLDRILFGTDGVVGNPAANPAWALRTLSFELDGLGATEEEKEAVRWGTAARLLGIA